MSLAINQYIMYYINLLILIMIISPFFYPYKLSQSRTVGKYLLPWENKVQNQSIVLSLQAEAEQDRGKIFTTVGK